MARLFITQREIDFISDITKEVIKDVVGAKIRYYLVSEIKTKTHEVYDEAVKKIFDNPIIIDALVDSSYEKDTVITSAGVDKQYKAEVFVQYRDMIEKGINICIGDYFTYSDIIWEITEARSMRNIYGFAEHADGMRLVGYPARQGAIDLLIKGPTDIGYSDADAVQKQFYQQRGFETNAEGITGDKRALIENGILELPESGPREVSTRADEHDRSTFYDEE
jgi:hypothetical protein